MMPRALRPFVVMNTAGAALGTLSAPGYCEASVIASLCYGPKAFPWPVEKAPNTMYELAQMREDRATVAEQANEAHYARVESLWQRIKRTIREPRHE